MKQLSWIGYRFCLWLVFLICALLLGLSAFTSVKYGRHIGGAGAFFVSNMLALGIAIFFILMFRKISDKGKLLSGVLFLSIFALQIFFTLFVSHPMTIADPARPQNEALQMIYYQHGQMNPDNLYVQAYHNNHFITILFYYYFKLLSVAGISNVWIPSIILNFICIDLGIFFTFLAAKKIKGIAVANMTLLVFLFCPTTYAWLTSAYTNTFSFPFLMAILYFGLSVREPFRSFRDWIKYILLGILCVTGIFLRPTTAIAVIALVLYQGVCVFHEKNKISRKDGIIRLVLLLVTCGVTWMGCHKLIGRHVDAKKFTGNYPAVHWLMMGLNEENEGGFLKADSEFTISFPTLQEKKEQDMQRLKQRVKKLGVVGIGTLYIKKMVRVWALGDDDSIACAKYAYSYPVLYDYFMGEYNLWYLFYNQAFRIAMFLLMFIALLRQLKLRECTPVFLYALAFLGAVLFFMMWEAGRRYNVCFNGICVLLMAEGVACGRQYIRGRRSSVAAFFTGAVCLFVSGIVLSAGYRNGTVQKITMHHWNRLSDDAIAIRYMGIDTPNVMEQTVGEGQLGAAGGWNRLKIYFEDPGVSGDGNEWRVEVISREDDRVVYSEDIGSQNIDGTGAFTIRVSNKRKGRSKVGYVLRLTHLGEQYHLFPKIGSFPVLNPYPYGSLTVDGVKRDWDLVMKIYTVER